MTLALILAPVSLKLFTDRDEYNAFLKQKGLDSCDSDEGLSGSVYNKIVDGYVLIYISPDQTGNILNATLVHEAVHVFSRIRDYMGLGYDEEISAYGIESIFTQLTELYRNPRKHI